LLQVSRDSRTKQNQLLCAASHNPAKIYISNRFWKKKLY